MANAPAWAVGLILVVTLALISIVGTYDRGVHALIRQPGVSAAQATGYTTSSSISTWLEDALTHLRHDDRVAEALRSANANAAQLPTARLQTIAPAEPAAAAAASAGLPARATADPAGVASSIALGSPRAAPSAAKVDMSRFGKDLSRELVAAFASDDKIITVTFVNAHYMDFARNWVRHLRESGNPHFLIGALDDEAYTALRRDNEPSFDMAASLTTRDFGWGSKVFKQAQQKKIAMFLSVLEYGYDVLLSDVDVMWLRDPFVFFRSVPEADMLVSSDLLSHTTVDDGPETRRGVGATLNVGIIFMRPTNGTKKLTRVWNDMCSKNLDFWEQAAFNQLARRGMVFPSDRGVPAGSTAVARPGKYADRLGFMFGGTVPAAVLPVSMFCSGHTAFVQHLPERLNKQPYAVHATFQFAGTNGKRHRMREWKIWQDEPAYYDPPNGLLAMELQVPAELLRPGGAEPKTVAHHFDLVNWQLARIRSGLILAELTGRVLIMPKLWCGFDRWWAPHQGRIPGSSMPLPIQCPLDHVFNIEAPLDPKRLREFSLLENRLTPRAVLDSQYNLSLPAQLSPAALREALKVPSATHAKVLRVTDMSPEVFQLGLEPGEQRAFMKRALAYTGIWCCIRPLKPRTPGHIW